MSKERKSTSEDRTTISIPRSEYDRLVAAKRKLESDPEYSWLAAVGLGGFIGFLVGLALRSPEVKPMLSPSYFRCSCGQVLDVTGSPKAFACSKCGATYIQQKPPRDLRHTRA